MSLHFSNGQVLLMNTSNSEWYYLAVAVDDDDALPHLAPSQVSLGDLTLEEFDEYVVLRCAETGDYYKLGLATNGNGDIDYSFSILTLPLAYRATRLFLKDQSTGLLYEVTAEMDPFIGGVYPAITAFGDIAGNTRTINSPFKCQSAVTRVTPACVVPATAMTEETIIVGPSTAVPVQELLIGEGGGALEGEGDDGEPLVGE